MTKTYGQRMVEEQLPGSGAEQPAPGVLGPAPTRCGTGCPRSCTSPWATAGAAARVPPAGRGRAAAPDGSTMTRRLACGRPPPKPLAIITTALDGNVRTQVALQIPADRRGPARTAHGGRRCGTTGDRRLTVDVGGGTDWRVYRMADGGWRWPVRGTDRHQPVVPGHGRRRKPAGPFLVRYEDVTALAPIDQEPLVVVDTKLHAECVSSAPDAPAGSPDTDCSVLRRRVMLWWWRRDAWPGPYSSLSRASVSACSAAQVGWAGGRRR